VYFFFNSLGLPKGLLFTGLLSPLFFYRQLAKKRRTWLLGFSVFLLCYDCVHLYLGVSLTSFVISNGFFITTYFTTVAFYNFINGYEHTGVLMKQLVVTNFILTAVAVVFFFLPSPYLDWFWWVNHLAPSKYEFPRLKLFTYEASYYSLIYVPVFYYFGLNLLFGRVQGNKELTAAIVFIPLLLSMSFGVLGATLLTALILGLANWKKLAAYRRAFILSSSLLAIFAIALLLLMVVYPENYVVKRLDLILQGNDTSAKGRTSDSFKIAWLLASKSSIWFGCGLGQIKIQIDALVKEHLGYWGNFARYDIPNAIGETLAIFGISGVVLRIGLQAYLFFKTRVASNYYRLALFLFIFIYQFTGSFITNIAEYTIWAIAFSSAFQQFNTKATA